MNLSIVSFFVSCCPAFVCTYLERIQASPIGRRLAHGTYWNIVGTAISGGLNLLSAIFVARLLGKAGFGELSVIQSTVGMFGAFAGIGIGLTATKYVAEFREKDAARAARIITLSNLVGLLSGGAASVGFFIMGPLMAKHILGAPHLSQVLRIGAFLVFFGTLVGVQNGTLSGFEAFKALARVKIWTIAFIFPLTVLGAYLGDLRGVVWAWVVGMIVNWIMNHRCIHEQTRTLGVSFTNSVCFRELPLIWKYGVPASLGTLIVGPVTWVCNLILVNQRDGYSEMGVFNAANQWFLVLMFFPSMITQASLPLLSEQMAHGNLTSSKKILMASTKMNSIILLPIVLLGSLFSHHIMSFYGPGFQHGWMTLVFSLCTVAILAFQAPFATLLQASDKMWSVFWMNGAWGGFFILGTLLLAGNGSAGLAAARLGAFAIHSLLTLLLALFFIRRF